MGNCPVINPGKTTQSLQLLSCFFFFFFFFFRKSLGSRRCPNAVVGMGYTPGTHMGSLAGEPFMYLVLIPWCVELLSTQETRTLVFKGSCHIICSSS